jgi:hypothetical protein
LTNVVEFTVTFDPEIDTAAPLWKPVPVMVTSWLDAPPPRCDGDALVAVGAAFTVKQLAQLPDCVSVFVTVTLRAPVAAPDAIVMFAVTDVAEFHVVEFTVIPAPENDALAPCANPVPAIVMFWFVAPCPRLEGDALVTVGIAATTVKHVQSPVCASEFVTTSVHAPGAADVMLNVAWIVVELLTTTAVPAIDDCPLFVRATVAPAEKPVPEIVAFTGALFEATNGDIDDGSG